MATSDPTSYLQGLVIIPATYRMPPLTLQVTYRILLSDHTSYLQDGDL